MSEGSGKCGKIWKGINMENMSEISGRPQIPANICFIQSPLNAFAHEYPNLLQFGTTSDER